MKYKNVRADFLDKLEKEVNRLIKHGWIPLGGVVIHYFEIGRLPKAGWTDSGGSSHLLHEFIQTMVLE